MFERDERNGRLMGYRLEHKNVVFYFGSRHLEKHNLYDICPEYEFAFLKQVHGAQVIEADPRHEKEADAHFSARVTRAPVVATADCVPLLLASKSRVCAVHAGWRGAAASIIKACAKALANDPVLYAAIGPHIGRDSFEVGRDVANQLMQAASSDVPASQLLGPTHADPGKVYFDLQALIRTQLQSAFGPSLTIFDCAVDTKTSADFCSYRREGPGAGRQYSFVVLNS